MASEGLIEVIHALESMEFVRGLAPRHLARLASLAREEALDQGRRLFREGDSGEDVYLVQEGRVALEIDIPGRRTAVLLTVGPGELLGWSSMFPGKRRTASARAVMPTRVIVINARALWQACEEDHDLGYALMTRVAEVIARRLEATRLQLLDVYAPEGESQRQITWQPLGAQAVRS